MQLHESKVSFDEKTGEAKVQGSFFLNDAAAAVYAKSKAVATVTVAGPQVKFSINIPQS